MPWCDPCSRWLAPTALADGCRCPVCGERVERPEGDPEPPPAKVPWHFWVLLAMVALYLGWRVIQLIGWVI